MKKYTLILTGLIIVLSCNKDIQYDLNIDAEIFINAEFIDSMIKQKITIYKNNPIKDQSLFDPIKNSEFLVEQLGNSYTFSSTDSGFYLSNIPFVLEGGEPYTVSYKVDTAELIETYETPYAIQIDSLFVSSDGFFRDIAIQLKSPIRQYFTYKLYKWDVENTFEDSIMVVDSIWTENFSEERFQVIEVDAGVNKILLPANERYTEIDEGTKLKVVITVISKQTSDYFLILNNYFETIATSSLYVNPPRFYQNHFYGVTYAFSRDSSFITL